MPSEIINHFGCGEVKRVKSIKTMKSDNFSGRWYYAQREAVSLFLWMQAFLIFFFFLFFSFSIVTNLSHIRHTYCDFVCHLRARHFSFLLANFFDPTLCVLWIIPFFFLSFFFFHLRKNRRNSQNAYVIHVALVYSKWGFFSIMCLMCKFLKRIK